LQAQVLAEAEDGGLAEEGLVVELQGIGEAELCCVSGGFNVVLMAETPTYHGHDPPVDPPQEFLVRLGVKHNVSGAILELGQAWLL
jgi:hypothetical protein